MCRLIAIACSLTIAAGAILAADLPVTLSVAETGGLARPAWPVTSGVPLPRGAVSKTSQLALKNASGGTVPCQFDTVTRWPDGSLKWVELNFQSDLAAGATKKYSLAKGQPAPPPKTLKLTENADAITVNTGAISFTIPKKSGRIIGKVSVAGKPVLEGSGVEIVGAGATGDGTTFSSLSGTVEQVTIERAGPMTARIYLVLTCSNKAGQPYIDVAKSRKKYKQKAGDWFKVRIRIQAYAGKPFINMMVSLTHAGPMDDSSDAFFKSAAMKFKPASPLTNAKAEGITGPVTGKGFVLFQYLGAGRNDYAMKFNRKSPKPTFKVLVNGIEKTAGKKSAGNVVATGAAASLGFGVRYFHEHAPTAIAVRSNEVSVELLPNDPEQTMHKLHGGRQRTHEVLLDFSTNAAAHLAAFQGPRLLAIAPPAWYADLEIFGMIAEEATDLSKYPAKQRDAIKTWHKIQRSMVESKRSVFKAFHYGWLDYGDLHWRPGWCNGHYDWSMGMMLQFLRTGQRKFFKAAEAMAWHRMDIAQNHCIEMGKNNARYTWGRGLTYYEKDTHRTTGSGPKQTHTWNRGVGYYGLITGNEMARQVAILSGKGLEQYFTGSIDDGKWRGNWRSRNPSYASTKQEQRAEGWSIENFLGCYEVTGDEKYKKYAANLFKATLLDFKRIDAWKGKGMASGALMFAYCMSPSCRASFYSRDPAVLAGIKYIIDEGLLHPEYGILKRTGKTADGDVQTTMMYGSKPTPLYNIFFANPTAYLYMQTGDKKYLEAARLIFRNAARFYAKKSGVRPGHGTKTGGWIGRFNHIYLYMEKQLANGVNFPRR